MSTYHTRASHPDATRARRMLHAGRLTVIITNRRDESATLRFRRTRSGSWFVTTPDATSPKGWAAVGWVDPVDLRVSAHRDGRADQRLISAAQVVVYAALGDGWADVEERGYQIDVEDECGRCGRRLDSDESRALGIGPECVEQRAHASA